MENKAIVLLTHGDFGKELLNSAGMVLGNVENCFAVSLYEDQTLDDYKSQVIKLIEEHDGNVLIITDILGGTPVNTAIELKFQYDIQIINGLSLEMFIIAYNLMETCQWENVTKEILSQMSNIKYDVCYEVNKVYSQMFGN